jgi:FkbM family methyltransferase
VAGALEGAQTFVDVGANVGVYALTVAQAFPDRQVIAVEPLPDNCARLTRAARLNGLENVRVVQGVVGPDAGRAVLHVNPLSDGGGSLVPLSTFQTGDVVWRSEDYQRRHPGFAATLDVESVPLDDLVSGPSVVKIDVEGAEAAVLRSGERALAKGLIDALVVEVQSDTAEDVVRFLAEAQFDCFLYGRRLPLAVGAPVPLPYRVGNLVCLRRGSRAYDRLDFR